MGRGTLFTPPKINGEFTVRNQSPVKPGNYVPIYIPFITVNLILLPIVGENKRGDKSKIKKHILTNGLK